MFLLWGRCSVESEKRWRHSFVALFIFSLLVILPSEFTDPKTHPSRLCVVTPGHILTDGTEKENKRNPPFPQHHTVRYQSRVFLKGVWIMASVSKNQSMLDTDK